MGRLKKSKLLLLASWHAFKLDKESALLPLLSFLVLLPLFVIGVVASVLIGERYGVKTGESTEFSPLGSIPIIIMGALIAATTTIFMGALTNMALARFKGEDPTIKSSLKAAWQRKGALVGFGLLSFGIAQLISEIANRIPILGGKIVIWLAGAAWNVAAFFTVPVIMSTEEPVTPLGGVRKSVAIIKQTWGESLIITASVSIFAVLGILAYLAIGGAMAIVLTTVMPIVGGIFGGLLFLGMLALLLVIGVLDAYAKAALYYYATTGIAPLNFNQEMLRQAFSPKKAKKLFL